MLNQQCSSQTRAFQPQVFLGKQLPDKEVDLSNLITIPKVQSSQMLCPAPFAGVCSSITLLRKLTTQTVGCREEMEPPETMNPTFFSTRMQTPIQSALMIRRWTCMPIVLHMTHITDFGDRQSLINFISQVRTCTSSWLPMAFTFFVGNFFRSSICKGFLYNRTWKKKKNWKLPIPLFFVIYYAVSNSGLFPPFFRTQTISVDWQSVWICWMRNYRIWFRFHLPSYCLTQSALVEVSQQTYLSCWTMFLAFSRFFLGFLRVPLRSIVETGGIRPHFLFHQIISQT